MQTLKLPSKDGEVVVEIFVRCPVCGGHIDQDADASKIKIKCKWCVQQRAAGRKDPNTILEPEEKRYCNWCGNKIEPEHPRNRKYCSDDCCTKANNIRDTSISVKNCQECDEKFMQKRSTQRFCSKKCSRRFTDRVPAIFRNIRFRCDNEKSIQYKNYGGKGVRCLITLDEFTNLYNTAETCPICGDEFQNGDNRKMKSIDRIDSNGHYHLKNVRIVCRSCNSKRRASKDEEEQPVAV